MKTGPEEGKSPGWSKSPGRPPQGPPEALGSAAAPPHALGAALRRVPSAVPRAAISAQQDRSFGKIRDGVSHTQLREGERART